ncbi:MAG TPA: efflux RND transporter permease subunit [Planctomycetota bacterium]|nr:efflux RND transporter permease subunit [Planctomycetota bacterium]
MKLSDAAIRKPVFAWMLMAALIVFGAIGLSRLGVSQMPDVDFPQVTVRLTLEGASPETMETDVVELVEDACMSVEGITDISSNSQQGSATVTLEFEVGRDIDAALQETQTKVAQAQRRLPEAMDPPVITKSNPEDQPILWVAVSGSLPPQELADIARFQVRERLQTVPGVGEVLLGGFRDRSLRVWLDAQRMDARGVTAADVTTALRREHLELPAGRLEDPERETNVRLRGEALDVAAFRDLVVSERDGAVTRLSDVATIEDGLEDRRLVARNNGEPAQGVGIRKQRGANAVEIARAVRRRLVEIRETLPPGAQVQVSFDTTAPVEESIHEIGFTMVLAVLLTALVCWLFLGSISSTVNVLLSIPTSVVGTFAVMHFLGFTLNTFTLLGLSLAVGIVVDDAIMVLENIFRRAEHGDGRVRAAVMGAREISFAAMAASAAIVAIFLPVAFMQGIVGRFFFQFGVTISVAVLLSLLEALTLTPSRCSQFLAVGERRTRLGRGVEAAFHGLAAGYARSIPFVLRWRWLVVLLGVGLFVASLALLKGLRRELTPSQDMGRAIARVQTPVGSSIDSTDAEMREIEKVLFARPEVANVFMSLGGGPSQGLVNTATVNVTLVPRSERALSYQEFVAEMRPLLSKGAARRVAFQDLSQQGFTARRGFPVEIALRGRDWATLATAAVATMERMRDSPLFADVDSDYRAGMPETRIRPDRDRAATAGVSVADLAEALNVLVGGVRVGTWEDRGRRYDIRVRLLSDQRTRERDLALLRVRARDGSLVPLSSLVAIETTESLFAITRRGRERAISVFANVPPTASQADAIERAKAIALEVLPPGYSVVLSGQSQALEESFRELAFALLLGVIVAYMILASQFNSFVHPITVLVALPFSVSGALAALAWTDLSLNLYSFIGIVLLMGIVKKNSILLVDFTNQRRLAGASRDQALIEACPTRLRPILMTTMSTLAGALPAALAQGPGGEVRQPMAVAVLGGVAVSTLLTLFVVPSLYSLFDSLTSRFAKSGEHERVATQVLAELEAEEIRRRAEIPVPPGAAGDATPPPPGPAS